MVVEPFDSLLVTRRDHGVQVLVVSRVEVEELVTRIRKFLAHLLLPGLATRSRALREAFEGRFGSATEDVLLHQLDEGRRQRLSIPALGHLLAILGTGKYITYN